MNNAKSKETGAKTKRNRPDVQIYRPPAIRNTQMSTSKSTVTKIQSTKKTTKTVESNNAVKKTEADINPRSSELEALTISTNIQSINTISSDEQKIHKTKDETLNSSIETTSEKLPVDTNDKNGCTNDEVISLQDEIKVKDTGIINEETVSFNTSTIKSQETEKSVVKAEVHVENSKNNLHQLKTNHNENDSILKISESNKLKIKSNNDDKIYSLSRKKSDKETDEDVEEFLRASEGLNRCNKRLVKNTLNQSDVLIIEDSVFDEEKVDDWEQLLDDSKLLDSSLFNKIGEENENLSPSLSKEENRDVRKRIVDSSMTHIIEIYGFPTEFQTRDLITIFEHYRSDTYHIKWVDDNHALGVFPSESVATEVLKIQHPLIKLRPMSEASKQAILKAKKNPNAMLPVIARPQTCPQTARRMVTGALGLKLKSSKEEREKEKQILKEAREKKRLALKQQDDAWEGKIMSLH